MYDVTAIGEVLIDFSPINIQGLRNPFLSKIPVVLLPMS